MGGAGSRDEGRGGGEMGRRSRHYLEGGRGLVRDDLETSDYEDRMFLRLEVPLHVSRVGAGDYVAEGLQFLMHH